MLDNKCEKLIGVRKKVNSINIDLRFEPRDILNKQFFFICKKQCVIDLYTIYDSNKHFIYILASWLNLQYNTCIFALINIY